MIAAAAAIVDNRKDKGTGGRHSSRKTAKSRKGGHAQKNLQQTNNMTSLLAACDIACVIDPTLSQQHMCTKPTKMLFVKKRSSI
jgi:hypothetical protein